MVNALTGDFDAVLQVAESTINRLMATLHQNAGNPKKQPSHPHVISLHIAGEDSVDGVLGWLNAQLGVPRITLLDRVTDRFELEVDVRARFFEDDGSAYLPMYFHGVVRATYHVTPIDRRCLGWAKYANDYFWVRVLTDTVRFTGATSGVQDPEVDARVEHLIAHLLGDRFEAAPHKIGADIRAGRMLSLTSGSRAALAVPISITGGQPSGDINSIQQTFVRHYDFAVAIDVGVLMKRVDAMLQHLKTLVRVERTVEVKTDILGWETTTDIAVVAVLTNATATWMATDGDFVGSINVKVDGEITDNNQVLARFTIETSLTVDLIGPYELHASYHWNPRIDVFDTPWLVNFFAPSVKDVLKHEIREALHTVLDGEDPMVPVVRSFKPQIDKLNAQMRTLDDAAVGYLHDAQFNKTSVVLFGKVTVSPRKPPVIDYSKSADGDGFTAFASWAPGGWVERFIWSWWTESSAQESTTIRQRYILTRRKNTSTRWGKPLLPQNGKPLPGLDRPGTVCLEIRGYQTDSVTGQRVPFRKKMCTRYGHPLSVPGKLVQTMRSSAEPTGMRRDIGLIQLGNAPVDPRAPNTLIVYTAGRFDREVAHVLASGLEASIRDDAGLLVVVLVREGVAVDGGAGMEWEVGELGDQIGAHIVLMEDAGQSWTDRLAIPHESTAWRLITPNGGFTWSHDGDLRPNELARALDDHLRPAPPPAYGPIGAAVTPATKAPPIGIQRPRGPNCPRMRLPTVDTGLIFVVEGSHTSELQLDMTVDHWRQTLGQAPGLLAIIDGDEEAAAAVARRYPDIDVIADPDGDIAAQFGIRIWPTLIGVDGDGLMTIVRHGVFEFDEAPEVRDEDVEVESGGEP